MPGSSSTLINSMNLDRLNILNLNNNIPIDLSKIKIGSKWVQNKNTVENCFLYEDTNELEIKIDSYGIYTVSDFKMSNKFDNVMYLKLLLTLYNMDDSIVWSDKICLGIIHGNELTIIEGSPFKINKYDSDTQETYKLDSNLNISSRDLFIKRFTQNDPYVKNSLFVYVGDYTFVQN